jgi:hypothetical protein
MFLRSSSADSTLWTARRPIVEWHPFRCGTRPAGDSRHPEIPPGDLSARRPPEGAVTSIVDRGVWGRNPADGIRRLSVGSVGWPGRDVFDVGAWGYRSYIDSRQGSTGAHPPQTGSKTSVGFRRDSGAVLGARRQADFVTPRTERDSRGDVARRCPAGDMGVPGPSSRARRTTGRSRTCSLAG